jgi:predicted  nucleic acid-binding Zn-ribbon protein
VKPDVAALLDVQADDLKLYGIEDRLNALAPRLAALEHDRKKAVDALAQTREQVAAEEKRQREINDRLRQHRELKDRSEGLLNQVTSPREAAAAMAQIDQAKRFIGDEEREIEALNGRLGDLRHLVADRENTVKEIERVQEETRASLDADRSALEKELAQVRAERDRKAQAVPRSLLQRYDRIRQKRRATAIFPLRGESCAHCDTAIPMQRRSTMVATGATELCEACGVLLYSAG